MIFAAHTKLIALVMIAGLFACGENTKFSAPKKGLIQSTETPCREKSKGCGNDDVTLTDNYRYIFELADGARVVRQGPTKALGQIFLNEAKKPLADQSKAWKVSYKSKNLALAEAHLGEASLDLSSSSGLISVTAEFKREADDRSAKVVRSIFVDSVSPVASLIDLGQDAGDQKSIFWNAYDNFGLNIERSAMIACEIRHNEFLPNSREEMENIPADCIFIFQGEALHNLASQSKIGPYTVEGTSRIRDEFMLYVEDEVGLTGRAWTAKAAEGAAQLLLTTNPTGSFYTHDANFNLMTLLTRTGGGVPNVDIHNSNAEWPNYEVNFSLNNASPSKVPYTATRSVPLPLVDGMVSVELQANHKTLEHLISNKAGLNVIVDRTPPVVKVSSIHVDSSVLNPTAVVNLRWTVQDTSPIFTQAVEIQLRGQSTWTYLDQQVAGAQRSLDFVWGSRPVSGFSIRVTAKDVAGNQGQGSEKWTPQIFNTALLTRGVECLYCHIKVQGDMGGIDFPKEVRHDTGSNFTVTGKVYSTNTMPRLGIQTVDGKRVEHVIPPIGIRGKVAEDFIENYQNTDTIIFPKNDANGKVNFPAITEAMLRERMNGVLEAATVRIERIFENNIIIKAAAPNCFKINGEVLIVGDLVIGGCYTGQGSIYTTGSIFVIDELQAVKPMTKYSSDPLAAKDQARNDLAEGKDQLFLGALKQIVVGTPENGMPGGVPIAAPKNPYSWLPKTEFQTLCKKSERIPGDDGRLEVPIGSSCCTLQTIDPRVLCGGMSDIQAYLYASEAVHVRTFRNFRIMGGVFTPNAAFLSSYMWRTNAHGLTNPVNGENTKTNAIYFDERLKHGSKVGEAIKSFFDQ